jgi:hypothetical protein
MKVTPSACASLDSICANVAHPNYLRLITILSSHLSAGLPRVLFPSDFEKTLCTSAPLMTG